MNVNQNSNATSESTKAQVEEDLAITETGEGLAQQLIVRLAELEKKLERLGEAAAGAKPGAPQAGTATGDAPAPTPATKPPTAAPAPPTPSTPRASAMAPGVTAEPRMDAARMAKLAAAGDRRALAEYLRMRRKE